MATLYENIIALCQSRGIKGGKMCTDLGISKSTMTELKMGRKKGLSATNAQKIASYFGVTVGCLLGEEDKPTAQGDEFPGKTDGCKSVFYDRYAQLCEKHGISMSAAALEAGLSKSLVTKWKVNEVDVPSPDVLKKLSTYFGIPVSELLGEDKTEEKPTAQGDGLSEKKQELINCIKALPDDNILTLLQIARMMELINCTKALPENEILTLLRVVKSIR